MSAVQKAQNLAESLNMLPPLPEVARQILTDLNDEFVTGEEVAEVVGKDPGISARLIALANSAYFGLSKPVGDIAEVVNRVLGVDNVRSLSLALAADHVFDSSRCDRFDTQRFWVGALLMADSTRRVIDSDTEADDDDRALAYQTGLCHNVGLLALAYLLPLETNVALGRHLEQDQEENKAEDARKNLGVQLIAATGMDHRQVTFAVAQAWSLPAATVAAYEPVAHSSSRLHCALDVARLAVGDRAGKDARTISDPLVANAAPTPRQRERTLAMVEGINL